MKIPGLTTLKRLNPVKPLENLVNLAALSILKKFLASAGKSLLTAIIAALTAATAVPPPTDLAAAKVWLIIVLGIRTLISVVGRVGEHLIGAKPSA